MKVVTFQQIPEDTETVHLEVYLNKKHVGSIRGGLFDDPRIYKHVSYRYFPKRDDGLYYTNWSNVEYCKQSVILDLQHSPLAQALWIPETKNLVKKLFTLFK